VHQVGFIYKITRYNSSFYFEQTFFVNTVIIKNWTMSHSYVNVKLILTV